MKAFHALILAILSVGISLQSENLPCPTNQIEKDVVSMMTINDAISAVDNAFHFLVKTDEISFGPDESVKDYFIVKAEYTRDHFLHSSDDPIWLFELRSSTNLDSRIVIGIDSHGEVSFFIALL